MDESRNSHRLLHRFALLAAIHGFSATAVSGHLYAADHSLQPHDVASGYYPGNVHVNQFAEAASAVTTQPRTAPRGDFSSANVPSAEPRFVGDWPTANVANRVNAVANASTLHAAIEAEAVQFHVALPLPKPCELDASEPKRLPRTQEEVPVALPVSPGPSRLPSANPATEVAGSVATSGSTPLIHPVATRSVQADSFTALAAMSQSTPPWIQPHLELPPPEMTSTDATMNSSKLRDMARESLRDANSRLKRDATHSAHKIANEALELLVAMNDARDGGTAHARQLTSAMNAIRESKDFWSTRGPIDHDTLVRSIAVHETDVLHGKSLESTSALDASAIYLGYAKDQLTLAGKSVPETSDALVLLGRIEKQLADPSDPHAAAVALTMHRAAVAVDPTNGYCRRELGKALLYQGLNEEALEELKIANKYQPTRGGFQSLREAALRVGDNQLANQCIVAMSDRRLPPDSPVLRLAPEQFAATHRPSAVDLNRQNNSATKAESSQNTSPQVLAPHVTDKKSWFPFGRR